MARIRSVHPGQWHDDDFLDLTPWAALLALALRNVADDQGVFEWKPAQLRRACLPQLEGALAPVLEELAQPKLEGPHKGLGRHIQAFAVHGRHFGIIRNFAKWQRPRKPSTSYLIPKPLFDYAGFSGKSAELDWLKAIPNAELVTAKDASGSALVPNSPLLEAPPIPAKVRTGSADEGGRRKEEGGNSVPSVPPLSAAQPKAPSGDDRTWLFNEGMAYIVEATGKQPAQLRALLGRWLKELSDDASRLRAVIEEAAKLEPAEPMAWLSKAVSTRKTGQVQPARTASEEDEGWRWVLKVWRERKAWNYDQGPNPDQPGTAVPAHILAEFPPGSKAPGSRPFGEGVPDRGKK